MARGFRAPFFFGKGLPQLAQLPNFVDFTADHGNMTLRR
jgi:hypothetical protein